MNFGHPLWVSNYCCTFSVIGVRLPGRETRRNEQPIGNLDKLISFIADAIVSQFSDKPFAFFGHRRMSSVKLRFCSYQYAFALLLKYFYIVGWLTRVSTLVESWIDLLFYLALNLSTNDNVIIFCSLIQNCGIRTFFFSLGIFLSYHVARYLKQCEHQTPVHLFFSSHFAPHVSIYS